MTTDIECVWAANAVLGEGPIWVEAESALYWVDIKAPAINRYRPETGATDTWPMPERIGCIAKRRDAAGFVAGCKTGFKFVDPAAGTFKAIGDPEPDLPDNRFNDGVCDAAGRFWAGSMDDSEGQPTGKLYRLDSDLSWRAMDDGYVVTNGPAFSTDGRTCYHADTFKRLIYAFDVTDDGLANKRVHIEFPDGAGYPDGLTIDAENHLWAGHWDGWRLTRFAPDGRVDRIIEMPVGRVTKCAFGGPDLDALYVTTATIGLGAEARAKQPLAGGLFRVDAGVRGLPAPLFAG